MYLGTSDAIQLAEEIAESVINGQFSQVLRWIKERELNTVQAMYVMGIIHGKFLMATPMLNERQLESLMKFLSHHLNDEH